MAGNWRTCDQCGGACIANATSCLAHAEPEERAAALKQFSKSGELDARGLTISDALLQEILEAAPRKAYGHPKFSGAGFEGATFEGQAGFEGATFEGQAGFKGATFEGYARFNEATFEGQAGFDGVTFKSDVWFNEATFEGYAVFNGATFEGYAAFDEATFKSHVWLELTTFKSVATFRDVTFKSDARFAGATFEGTVLALGPLVVGGRLDLGIVQFASGIQIHTDASALTCDRTRFSGGVRFDVRRAVIRLDDSDFSVPSLLTGPPASLRDSTPGR